MKYLITGTTSGIGQEIKKRLGDDVHELNRDLVDLDRPDLVKNIELPDVDCAVLNAGHDLGGGVPFTKHDTESVLQIINCNLVSNILLSQKLLRNNNNVMIVFITSTNLNQQYPNNLVYNLTKLGIKNLLDLIKIDFPEANIKEARVGLTKTQFNLNRHRLRHKPINDLYSTKHLVPEYVADRVVSLIHSNKQFEEINAE